MEKLAAIQKRTQQAFLQQVSDAVESSPNSNLAKVILFLSKHSNLYVSRAPESLQISQEEFLATLNYLVGSQLIRINTRGFDFKEEAGQKYADVILEGGVEGYLVSDLPFGPNPLMERQDLGKDITLRVMENLANMMEFSYSRNFSFDDLTLLIKLREQSHIALDSIRKAEAQYWHEHLDIPPQFWGFPSFVSKEDPTRTDVYNLSRFELSGKFSSPREAFEIGFDSAQGFPLTSREYKSSATNQDFKKFPRAINVMRRKLGYDIRLDNFLSFALSDSIFEGVSLAYLMEAKELLPEVRERIEKVLG